ncbi:MAG: response regulator [Chloroflexi bacterium]|nr:response regulator [Chloroflexota bacterium]
MSNKTALIVEDDKDSARLYTRIMKPLGYEFETVSNKDDALAWLKDAVPDLVLLDISLVKRQLDYSGKEILEYIRGETRMSATKVIVISAYSKLVDEIQDQADGTIIKPINGKKLIALIKSIE